MEESQEEQRLREDTPRLMAWQLAQQPRMLRLRPGSCVPLLSNTHPSPAACHMRLLLHHTCQVVFAGHII